MSKSDYGDQTLEELIEDIQDFLVHDQHLFKRWLTVSMHRQPELTQQAMQHVLGELVAEAL